MSLPVRDEYITTTGKCQEFKTANHNGGIKQIAEKRIFEKWNRHGVALHQTSKIMGVHATKCPNSEVGDKEKQN